MEYVGGGDQDSLRGKVFRKILDDILTGRYKSGDTLVESKLASELHVSRTPVREALKQLELEGLVSPAANRRVVVEGISERDINDIYVIRQEIEGLAARWATTNITEDQINELKHLLDLEEFYTIKNDKDRVEELDRKFHDLIFKASKSKPLRYILTTFHIFTKRARVNSLRVDGRMIKTLEEHRNILTAIENKEAEKAEAAMKKHIMEAKKIITSNTKN